MSASANPELVDDENPEWDEATFAEARPAADVLPAVFGASRAAAMLARRGRPRVAAPKEQLSLRLDADIVRGFRATGPGWQTRVNAALREWLAVNGAELSAPGGPSAHPRP